MALPNVRTNVGKVRAHTLRVAEEITHRWVIFYLWGIGPDGDHAAGRALDFMTLTLNQKALRDQVGNEIAAYLQANEQRLGVHYIIWRQRIWNATRSDDRARKSWGQWRRMADRGSPTENHMDHVHLSLLNNPPAYRPPQGDRMLTGPDISNHQGIYDWAAEKRRGSDFGFVKATEGVTFEDAQFPRNWREMKRLGLVRGAYHFARPRNSPTREADHFISYVRSQGLADNDMLALDLEVTDGASPAEVSAFARAFCARVQEVTGRRPIVYTNLATPRAGNCAGLGGYPLWIADPSRAAGNPRVPAPWKAWVIHQHDQSPIDRNVSRGLPVSPPTKVDEMPEPKDLWAADEIPVPSVYSEEYRQKNPTWQARHATTEIWEYTRRNHALLAQLLKQGGADVDEAALAAQLLPGLLASLSPQTIADAVNDQLSPELAQQVVDAIKARL